MFELACLSGTLGIFLLSAQLSRRYGNPPLLNPALLSVAIVAGALMLLRIPYPDYFKAARPIHFMLGPATVALAYPLYLQVPRLKAMYRPLFAALFCGSIAGILSAVFIGRALGLPRNVQLALAPKCVTTPIAMGIMDKLGGEPALAAVFVVLTGLVGATWVFSIMDLLRVKDSAVRGFAQGLSSHGFGTARAFQVDPSAGAFAGLAMGLNGLLTAILVPLLMRWLF
jgi:predicted murein hydrolase (TIGR00659 family)